MDFVERNINSPTYLVVARVKMTLDLAIMLLFSLIRTTDGHS